jgi:hypothetical protein
MSSIEHIVFKNDLLKSKSLKDLKALVIDKLKEIDISKFKMDPELTLMVCDIVWNICVDFKIKDDFNKIQLVIDILQPLFNYNPNEVEQIKTQITFFINNNQITIISKSKKIMTKFLKFIKKKVL